MTARERFASARVARLATTGPDGPHVVPIVFALAGDTIYHAVDHKLKRTTALKRLENLRADGTARILEPGFPEALALLAERYPQYREQPPQGPVIAIDVIRWSTWTATGR